METDKKYKLTNETIFLNGITLYRIEALKDFASIKKGEKGGFIESEDNLSQNGNCWVYKNAKVFENANIYGDAEVFGNAMVYGNAEVYENAEIYGNAKVYGDAWIRGKAKVFGNAMVFGNAKIYGDAKIYGNTLIHENAVVCENAEVYEFAIVDGNAMISDDATVVSNSDYIVFKNWWSSGRYFTWTRSNNTWSVGCFYGTGEELIAKAYKDSERSGKEYERVVKYVESILKDSKHS